MQQFTEQAILTTFQEMLREMPFDKVTVTELVRRCEISPNTFYYHFQDVYDLLDRYLVLRLEPYVKSADRHWSVSAKALLRACREEKSLVYHIFNSISRERLEQQVFSGTYDVFYQNLRTRPESRGASDEVVHELADYCCFAFLGFFLRFLWNHMEADIDASVEKLSALTEPFVQNTLREYKT